jgi:hypothetical protein
LSRAELMEGVPPAGAGFVGAVGFAVVSAIELTCSRDLPDWV